MAHSVCSFHSTCLNKLSHSLAESAHLPPSVNTSSFTKGYHAGLTVRKASFLSFESLVVPGGRRIMGSHGDVNRVSAIMSKGNGPATVQDETDDSSQVFEVPVESTYPTL